MLQKLHENDFDQVFRLMETSFPSDEYRTYSEQKALLDNPCYQIFVVKATEGEAIKAFLAVWEFDEVVFIEHFAVDPLYRNGGTGSETLAELSAAFGKRICLEVELPQNEMASRRIGFYQRNHFFLNKYPYVQPPISRGKQPIPLLIMTSGGTIDEAEFNRIKAVLYKEVYHIEMKEGIESEKSSFF